MPGFDKWFGSDFKIKSILYLQHTCNKILTVCRVKRFSCHSCHFCQEEMIICEVLGYLICTCMCTQSIFSATCCNIFMFTSHILSVVIVIVILYGHLLHQTRLETYSSKVMASGQPRE